MGGTGRAKILYLAPWVDIGGSDKATIDWFRRLDRDRFEASLITTQPSPNRRLAEVAPYAAEIWSLPDLMWGNGFPRLILDFIASREIDVVHIMNSRLAFMLLPDLAVMRRRPAIVVQLHVEEEDRSGYVRYVSTRYGNLVDSFSVTGHHLADAMADYDVPLAKRRVIHTGVDADEEFNPELIDAQPLAPGRFHVLYVGRLVDQKDPGLMLDVAAELVSRVPRALFHVVGEGALQAELEHDARARGLAGSIEFHGASWDVARWYRACHALLLTSRFEGIPCTLFEAMAMRLPVIAPALPGIAEILSGGGGALVAPRDDVTAYATELARLAADEALRRRIGEEARRHVREHYGVDRMADGHAALYAELLERRAPTATPAEDPARPPAIRMTGRPAAGQPLVSVVVPCFNHGRFLTECLQSIREQDYPAVETIVVDDASDDEETIAAIDALAREGAVRVLRLDSNRGPSAARNAALDVAGGRYVLPVDADNVLVPGAIARLVAQLQGGDETIGFIYPNHQYFGNRDEYVEVPDFNAYALLRTNYCDTCSLFDRAVFDAGVRFAEDIGLGHEDWDLMLQLADRGVAGQAARGLTTCYRKHGFTRSDVVEHAEDDGVRGLLHRHPALVADESVKARDCPGISVVQLAPIADDEALARFARRFAEQTVSDVELIVAFDGSWPLEETRHVRRVPLADARDSLSMLDAGLRLARAGRVLVAGDLDRQLGDRALLEKLLVILRERSQLDALAFADSGSGNALEPVASPEEMWPRAHAMLLNRTRQADWPRLARAREGREISDCLAALAAAGGEVQWRHLAEPATARKAGQSAVSVPLSSPPPGEARNDPIRRIQLFEPPLLPGALEDHSAEWTPPQTMPLIRHRHPQTLQTVVTNDPVPPAGFKREWDLGAVQRFSPPGTARLEFADGIYRAVESGGASTAPDATSLGHVETAPLPLLMPLLVGTRRDNAQSVLICGDDDPLLAVSDVHGQIGFIEGRPLLPRHPPRAEDDGFGVCGLLRALETRRGRHVYGTAAPDGRDAIELGALLTLAVDATAPLWVIGGSVYTRDYSPRRRRPSAKQVARWVVAPVTWRGLGRPVARAGAVLRRASAAPRAMLRERPGRSRPTTEPTGHLFTQDGRGRLPLWSAVHPITGDQLLTRNPWEAHDMGYGDVTLLGYMRACAPLSGELGTNTAPVWWASRLGMRVRYQ